MPPLLAETCPSATFTSDGLVLCGLLVDATDNLPPDNAFPVGCASFTQAFLDKLRRKLQLRLSESEQVVCTGEGAFHRADLIATAPEGTLWALDVSITASPGGGDTVHAHLERSAAAEASRYMPGGARGLPDGHTMVSLIYSSELGWLSLEGLAFLQRILSQVAACEPPLGVDAWRPHVSHVTQRHLAHLAHALHLSHWQMHHACGRLL